jgi:hypothetical protein
VPRKQLSELIHIETYPNAENIFALRATHGHDVIYLTGEMITEIMKFKLETKWRKSTLGNKLLSKIATGESSSSKTDSE